MKSKKAQEEIVGFVLIMVIVAVGFLIFLGFNLRQGITTTEESFDLYQFLESSMEYTTECSLRYEKDFAKLGDLFESCYLGKNCFGGQQSSCEVLEATLEGIFSESFVIDPESKYTSFEFESYFVEGEERKEIFSLDKEEEECGGKIRGSTYILPAFPGNIENSLKLCIAIT
jgi:hypothetical protein